MAEPSASLAEHLGAALLARGWVLGTAESCTGGGLASAVTDIPGSSAWFDTGWVTYSNASKQVLLGVSGEMLATHGAVSEPVVLAMTAGVLARRPVDVAVAISGVAGPGGGTLTKPVGLVCFAWAHRSGLARAESRLFPGGRADVRQAAVTHALSGILVMLAGV